MSELIFKIHPAKKNGRSGIELILQKDKGIDRLNSRGTDQILQTLDKLLKKNKIKLESLKDIKIEIAKEAGLTSQRIVKSIVKALSLDL